MGALYSLAVVLVVWWLVSWIIRLPIVPSPVDVFINIGQIFSTKMEKHVLYSLGRIGGGIALSIIIGVPLGYLMGSYERVNRLLSPLVYFTYPVPKLALLPVVMLLFGLGEASKLIMIVLIVVFQIIVSSRCGNEYLPRSSVPPINGRQPDTDADRDNTAPGGSDRNPTGFGYRGTILFFTEPSAPSLVWDTLYGRLAARGLPGYVWDCSIKSYGFFRLH